MKKILYISNNPETEYEEVKALIELGYKVYSLGEQYEIRPDSERYLRELVDPKLFNLFKTYHPSYEYGKLIGLHHKIVEEFDLFIVSDHIENLTLNWKLISKKKVIWVWRKPERLLPKERPIIANYSSKGLKVLQNPGGKTQFNKPVDKEVWKSVVTKLLS
jgi:hypothetical protein